MSEVKTYVQLIKYINDMKDCKDIELKIAKILWKIKKSGLWQENTFLKGIDEQTEVRIKKYGNLNDFTSFLICIGFNIRKVCTGIDIEKYLFYEKYFELEEENKKLKARIVKRNKEIKDLKEQLKG